MILSHLFFFHHLYHFCYASPLMTPVASSLRALSSRAQSRNCPTPDGFASWFGPRLHPRSPHQPPWAGSPQAVCLHCRTQRPQASSAQRKGTKVRVVAKASARHANHCKCAFFILIFNNSASVSPQWRTRWRPASAAWDRGGTSAGAGRGCDACFYWGADIPLQLCVPP